MRRLLSDITPSKAMLCSPQRGCSVGPRWVLAGATALLCPARHLSPLNQALCAAESLGQTWKVSSSICIHSLWFCRGRPGNWVIGDLENQGMQSHCFLTKSRVPSEANSKPVNDSPMTMEVLKTQVTSPLPQGPFRFPKVRVGSQWFLSFLYIPPSSPCPPQALQSLPASSPTFSGPSLRPGYSHIH